MSLRKNLHGARVVGGAAVNNDEFIQKQQAGGGGGTGDVSFEYNAVLNAIKILWQNNAAALDVLGIVRNGSINIEAIDALVRLKGASGYEQNINEYGFSFFSESARLLNVNDERIATILDLMLNNNAIYFTQLQGEISENDTRIVKSGKFEKYVGGQWLPISAPSTLTNYIGEWNANTNTPTIQSGIGNTGDWYKVSVSGTTNINNISVWNVDDYIWFSSSTNTWQKIDNSTVGSVPSVGNDWELVFNLGGKLTSTSSFYFDGDEMYANVFRGFEISSDDFVGKRLLTLSPTYKIAASLENRTLNNLKEEVSLNWDSRRLYNNPAESYKGWTAEDLRVIETLTTRRVEITVGTPLVTPQSGVLEYTGTELYFTASNLFRADILRPEIGFVTVGTGGQYLTIKDAVASGKYCMQQVGNIVENTTFNLNGNKIIFKGNNINTLAFSASVTQSAAASSIIFYDTIISATTNTLFPYAILLNVKFVNCTISSSVILFNASTTYHTCTLQSSTLTITSNAQLVMYCSLFAYDSKITLNGNRLYIKGCNTLQLEGGTNDVNVYSSTCSGIWGGATSGVVILNENDTFITGFNLPNLHVRSNNAAHKVYAVNCKFLNVGDYIAGQLLNFNNVTFTQSGNKTNTFGSNSKFTDCTFGTALTIGSGVTLEKCETTGLTLTGIQNIVDKGGHTTISVNASGNTVTDVKATSVAVSAGVTKCIIERNRTTNAIVETDPANNTYRANYLK